VPPDARSFTAVVSRICLLVGIKRAILTLNVASKNRVKKPLFMYCGATDPHRAFAVHQKIEGSVSQGHFDRHCDLFVLKYKGPDLALDHYFLSSSWSFIVSSEFGTYFPTT
jgi:hypothetical protein